MFLEYLYNLPNSTEGIDAIAIQTIGIFPGFVPMLLLFVFLVVFIGGSTRQKLTRGSGDYAAWAVIASIATLLPALLFSMQVGYIQLDWLIIVVSLNILSAIWFFLDKRVTEV